MRVRLKTTVQLVVVVAALQAVGCLRAPPADDPLRFTRLDDSGAAVERADAPHRCVLDRYTTLLWAVPSPGDPLFDATQTYTWFNTDKAVHNGDPGVADGGQCQRSPCNTTALVAAVNAEGLCGRRDWRLPTREEAILLGKHHGGVALGLDPTLFPQTSADEFWTSSTFRLYPASAWAFNPQTGLDRADLKTVPKPARLVAGTMVLPRRGAVLAGR